MVIFSDAEPVEVLLEVVEEELVEVLVWLAEAPLVNFAPSIIPS